MSDWKLVPIEPTEGMIRAGCGEGDDIYDSAFIRAYDAALAAAPTPPATIAWPPECEELCKAAEGMQRAVNELWKAEYPEELDEDQKYMDIDEAREMHTGAWNALHAAIHYMRKRMSAPPVPTPTPPAQEDEPVAYMDAHDNWDLYKNKPEQVDVIPLYTRPGNDKLRKAAERVIHCWRRENWTDGMPDLSTCLKWLNDALEGK